MSRHIFKALENNFRLPQTCPMAWRKVLEQLRQDAGLSKIGLEKRGIIGRNRYNTLLKAKKGPRVDILEGLLKGMGYTWQDWGDAFEGRSRKAGSLKTETDDLAMIPLLEFKAAAGGGDLIESERVLDELAFKRTWVKSKLRANPGSLKLIKVTGDSMAPTLLHGDLVMFDTSQRAAKHDQIFVVAGEDGKLVKRLCLKHGGVIEIHSDNLDPRYHLPAVKPGALQVLGRVVWAARRM